MVEQQTKNPKFATMYVPSYKEETRYEKELVASGFKYDGAYTRKMKKHMTAYIIGEYAQAIEEAMKDMATLGFDPSSITYDVVEDGTYHIVFRGNHGDTLIQERLLYPVYSGYAYRKKQSGWRGYHGTERTVLYELKYGELKRWFPIVGKDDGVSYTYASRVTDAQIMILKILGDPDAESRRWSRKSEPQKKVVVTFDNYTDEIINKERDNHISLYRNMEHTVLSHRAEISGLRKKISEIEGRIESAMHQESTAFKSLEEEKEWLISHGITELDGKAL